MPIGHKNSKNISDLLYLELLLGPETLLRMTIISQVDDAIVKQVISLYAMWPSLLAKAEDYIWCRWMQFDEILKVAPPFKRRIYEQLSKELASELKVS